MRQDAQAVISIKHIPRDTVSREANSRPRNIDIAVLSGFTCSDESTAIDRLEHVNQRDQPPDPSDPIRPIELSAASTTRHRHRGVSSCGFVLPWLFRISFSSIILEISQIMQSSRTLGREEIWIESKARLRQDTQFSLRKWRSRSV